MQQSVLLASAALVCAAIPAAAETNLVRNARFERVDAQGRAEAWRGWGARWGRRKSR